MTWDLGAMGDAHRAQTLVELPPAGPLSAGCTQPESGINSEPYALRGGNSMADCSAERSSIEVDKPIVADLTRRVINGAMKLASTKTATRRRLCATFVDLLMLSPRVAPHSGRQRLRAMRIKSPEHG